MKKVFLAAAISLPVLFSSCLAAALLSTPKYIADDYTETTATGGKVEAAYLKKGSHAVAYFERACGEAFSKYEVYYPSELEGSASAYPLVVFVNGTGVAGSRYAPLFEHLASWGFVVAGNEDGESWSGYSTDKTLSFMLEQNQDPQSVFYGKIDTANIGVSGHSQGGVGVFNAITGQKNSGRYKTAVALSPTHEEQAESLGWHYDLSKIVCPVLLLAGTEGDFETKFVIPYEKMLSMFGKIQAQKVMARKAGCEHGEMLYAADGYVTAWFMWQLRGDQRAAGAFTGAAAELLTNGLYQDQKINMR